MRTPASPKGGLKVISASRRVDMVAGYRDQLMELLRRDWPPERVHTVVVWTKNPPALASDDSLREFLSAYDQIFLHLTVTGLGGSDLEPHAPPREESIASLSSLVDFVGDPERIRLRFDPLIEVQTRGGGIITNLNLFDEVVGEGRRRGIRNVSTSWVTSYRKVKSRLRARGMEILEKSEPELKALWTDMKRRAEPMDVALHACCVPGLPPSRCIDGETLNRLHPKGALCSTARAKDQRPACGCTESFDIGWYKSCPTGCLYCYGNPAVGEGPVRGIA